MAEVIVEGRKLDVMEGLDFSFNYSIADVRDPNKRSTEYSKTIKCPATKSNDELFGNIWEVNISNVNDPNSTNIEANFNPNKKADARVIADGVEVMAGVVQLRAINILNGRYDYEVVFIGKLINFFAAIGKKKLSEIDFSDLDHDYTSANVQATWGAGLDYVYPMIDYGDDFDSVLGDKKWTVRQFRPAVYAKAIMDRIFSFAGFTYDSTFLTSDPFTNLIIPFSGEQIYADDDQTNNRKFRASLSAAESPYTSLSFQSITQDIGFRTLRLNNDSTGGNFDTGNNWNTSTWVYNVPNDGYYGFNVTQTLDLDRIIFNPTRTYDGQLLIRLQIIRTDNALNTTIIGESIQAFVLSNNPQVVNDSIEIATSCEQQLMNDGDKVQFRFLIDFSELLIQNLLGQTIPNSNFYTDFELVTTESTGFSNPSNLIFEGDTMVMNKVVPDVVMVDFIMAFVRMFNLYITANPLNETELIIQTRDEYYAGGTTRDWTYKLARDRNIKLTPLGLLSAKVYNYQYKEDGDYYNERYQYKYNEPYGTRRFEVDNDFLTQEKTVDVIFSPTPLQIEGNTNRFVPRIYDNDISEGANPTESNVRVLYHQMLPTYIWLLKSELLNGTTAILTEYPYAGHLNHPITPTFDLSFGIPDELFYQANAATGTLQYTNANLFNVYHRTHVNEITNKDSKLFTGEFYLNPWDIEKLDFRDQILIDNCYWRLNRVMDYNPFKESLTKVELFKVLDIVPQPVETFTLGSIGSVGSGGDVEDKPIVDRRKKQLSQFNSYNGQVNGKRNIVAPNAMAFKILGDDNFIGDSSRNVSIVGDNNYVSSGLENVVIVNSDNQQVYQSNVMIVNNEQQDVGIMQATLTIPSAQILTGNSTPIAFGIQTPTGYAVKVLALDGTLEYGTATYATNGNMVVRCVGATDPQAGWTANQFLFGTLTRSVTATLTSSTGVTSDQLIEGADVEAFIETGNPTAGDSMVVLYLTYRFIQI